MLGNGNRKYGNKGSGYDYELKSLKGLKTTIDAILSLTDNLDPLIVVHNTVSATSAGNVPAGSLTGTVFNAGGAAGTWNGISLPAGIAIEWSETGINNQYGSIAYDATGTTFIITYTTPA